MLSVDRLLSNNLKLSREKDEETLGLDRDHCLIRPIESKEKITVDRFIRRKLLEVGFENCLFRHPFEKTRSGIARGEKTKYNCH
jgi:hypothetical protein